MAASDNEYQADPIRNAVIAGIARRRLERSVKLNVVEAKALITDFVVEGARDGRSVADLTEAGGSVLNRSQVMDGISEMLPLIRVVANFPDGTFPVFVHNPIR